MAGDWIKMRADLQRHPKVVRMSSALNADRFRIIGGLHAVWSLFDEHSEDGQIEGYTAAAIDDLIGWAGFCAAMVTVQWIEISDGFCALPRFDEHNGQSAKRRAMETQRKRRERAEEEARQAELASASDADKKRSRTDKREEDGNTVPKGTGGQPPKSPADAEKSRIWAELKTSLVDQKTCKDVKAAGALLGKAATKYGNDVFLDACRETLKEARVDTHTYLIALCERAAGKRVSLGKPQDNKHAGAAAAIFEGATHV